MADGLVLAPRFRATVWPLLRGAGIALLGALIARLIGMPLPWMLGPLLLVAATRIAGVNSTVVNPVRNLGQCLIGVSLGLYFTAEVASNVLEHWPVILTAVAFAVFLGIFGSWVLMRYAGLDFSTAWFASAIGGASEMAYMAERRGLRADLVASVHSVRVLIVVVVIPFAFQLVHQMPERPIDSVTVHGMGLVGLFALAAVAAYIFDRLSVPNAWMLGPMLAVLLLTVQGVHWSDFPPALSSLGQLCIGWSLGNRFRSDFFKRAPWLLLIATVFTFFMLLLTLGLAWSFHHITGLSVEVLVLALSPGGIAEMAITAKVLGLGVPLVTAVHVSRLLLVLLSAGPMHRMLGRRYGS